MILSNDIKVKQRYNSQKKNMNLSNNYSNILFQRLERLFLLLETGQSTFLRKSAAYQIGEIVKTHPNELGQLLEKVIKNKTKKFLNQF